ncbi:hypothetical protein KJY77_03615 [Canibacter sp. lx-72]|uniref:monovalent cation/H+ antiporter complex subunit F n=1 Tax=Canibacter zhuwentaonis TaxID=2837491 RepID=UPI001BDDBB16|nr:hypothetical protein [Canibacter zhuwentaonis]
MSLPEMIIVYGGGSLFVTAGLLTLIRAIKGPTVLDRIVAADVFLTIIVSVMGIELIVNRHTHTVAVMVGATATAALATITVARFVRRRAKEADELQGAGSYTQMIDVSGAAENDDVAARGSVRENTEGSGR